MGHTILQFVKNIIRQLSDEIAHSIDDAVGLLIMFHQLLIMVFLFKNISIVSYSISCLISIRAANCFLVENMQYPNLFFYPLRGLFLYVVNLDGGKYDFYSEIVLDRGI